MLLIFYFTIHLLSKKTIINNYTMVFMCQRVPLDIETLPIHMGGNGVLQYLITHFNQLPEHKQRAVLRAIGELEDEKNIDFLNQYLTHPNHPPTLRAEAYWAIHAMHSSQGQQTLERAHDQIANDSLLKYQIQQLEY
jgi:hypothetical protein